MPYQSGIFVLKNFMIILCYAFLLLIPALLLDSLIFVPLEFFGAGLPLLLLITDQVAVKWLVGFLNIPFMYLNEWILFAKQDGK